MRKRFLIIALLPMLLILFSGGGEPASVEASLPQLGGLVAFKGEDGDIYLINPDGTGKTALTSDARDYFDYPNFDRITYSALAWSSDGRYLAWVRSTTLGEVGNVDYTSDIYVLDTFTQTTKMIPTPDRKTSIFTVDWRKDKNSLYVGYSNQEVESTCFTSKIKGFRIVEIDVETENASLVMEFEDGHFPTIVQPSPNPSLLAYYDQTYCEGLGNLCVLDLNTGTESCTADWAGRSSWSPDGTKIVYDTCSYLCEESASIHILEVGTFSEEALLSEVDVIYTDPLWSPAGDVIVYEKSRGPLGSTEHLGFWAIKVDGSKNWEIEGGRAGAGEQSFSPDGSHILYVKWLSDEKREIWLTSIDGRVKRKVTDGVYPVWQPIPTFCDLQPTCDPAPNSLNTCDLEVGDILLSQNLGGMYIFENLLFQGYWTHAGIYNGCGTVTESYGSFSCESSWACLSDQPGVVIKDIHESGFWTASDWAILRAKSDDAGKRAAVTYAAGQEGKRYNWIYPDKWTEDKFYCSQLVWRAYEKQGIDLDSNQAALNALVKWLGPWGVVDAAGVIAAVPPDDIYYDSDVNLVKERPGIGAALRRTVFRILSPAHLYVTDPEGRHTGVDPATGEVVEEIPGVFYSGPDVEPEFISVQDMADAWEIQVIGAGEGSYTLQVENVEAENHQLTDVVGETGEGSVTTYEATHLATGWNSKCYVGEQKSVEEALTGIRGSVVAVYQLKPDQTFARWFPDRPDVSTISLLAPYDQLFILVSASTNWVQESSNTSGMSLNLIQGWNGACYAGPTKPIADALSGIHEDVAILYRLGDGQTWARYIPGRPEVSNIGELKRLDAILMLVTKQGGSSWTLDP